MQEACKYPLGEILNIEDADYRAIDAVSQSGVRMFALDGPWTYNCRIVAKTHPQPVSKAMELGRAGHRFLEVGCEVDKVFAVEPVTADDKELVEVVNETLADSGSSAKKLKIGERLGNRSHAHKMYKERAMADADPDLIVIDSDKLDMYKGSVQALYDNEICRTILTEGENICEASIVRQDDSGVYFKCRADVLKDDRVIDYKFTKHRKPGWWKNDAKKDGALYQALYYMRLFDRPQFTWMLICNQPPHEAFAVTVQREALEDPSSPLAVWLGHLNRKASIAELADITLAELVDCYISGVWHHDLWYGEIDMADENW